MPHGGAFSGNCCSLLQEMKPVFVLKRLKSRVPQDCVHNIVIIFSIASFFIQMSKYFMYIKIL